MTSPPACHPEYIPPVRLGFGLALLAMLTLSPSRLTAQAGGYSGERDLSTVTGGLDSTMRAELRRHDVHGGVIAIVHRGRVILSRGYGDADTVGTPVDPDRTAFGVSSMSKVFTTMAVLQLVDRGLLRLDDPVSRYVRDVRLDGSFPRPVTVADLLTHTAGFDEASIGIAARTPAAIVPLGEYLARAMPPRVRPAGDVTSYSNHGFALAGLVVERVSRRPFSEYVRTNIFDSLGMTRSGFEQPLRGDVETTRALPLRRSGTTWTVVPRIYFNDAPASAMFTTAGDMSRFMIDFLDTTGSRRHGLWDASVARMQQPQFRNHPAVRGLTFGFRERRDGDVQSIEQGGDWQDYSSDLLLAPALGLGLFVALSNDAADRIAPVVWRQLIESVGAPGVAGPDTTPAQPVSEQSLARTSGTYRVNRYSRHTLSRLGVLTGAIRQERIERDGTQLRGAGTALHAVAPGVYVLERSKSLAAFRLPEDGGKATHLFFENSPYAAYERVPWYDDTRLHLALFAVCVAAFIAALAAMRRGSRSSRDGGWRSNVHRRTTALTALAGLTYLVLTGVMLGTVDIWEFQYGVPTRVSVALLLAFPVAALAVASAVTCVLVIAAREATAAWRMRCVAQTMASALFVGLLFYWRLF